MICPRCGSTNIEFIGHHLCRDCQSSDGVQTQFNFIPDTRIKFPHNVIFPNRNIIEFFRKSYIEPTFEN